MLASILASYVTKKQSLFSDPLPQSSPRLDARAIAHSQCHVLGLYFLRLLERSLTLLAYGWRALGVPTIFRGVPMAEGAREFARVVAREDAQELGKGMGTSPTKCSANLG